MKKIIFYFLTLLIVPLFAYAQDFSQTYFMGVFSPQQEAHDVSQNAVGVGTASCILTNDGLWFFITVNNLTGPITGAHFHYGEIGKEGPVVRDITADFTGMSAKGLWTKNDPNKPLNDSLMKALLLGKLYINIHTAQNPDGELRAQVILSSGVGLMAVLTPNQETTNPTSQGYGTGVFTLTNKGLKFEVAVDHLTSNIVAAHFHNAPLGKDAPPIRAILPSELMYSNKVAMGVWTPNDATQPLTDSFVRELLTGNIYINFHTANNPNGEIRGQLMVNGAWTFTSTLDTSMLANPSGINARGFGYYTLTNAGLIYHSTIDALTGSPTTAGFYRGPLGQPGNVLRNYSTDVQNGITSGYWNFSGTDPLDYTILQDLFRNNLYTSYHTQANPTGEAQGQITYMPGTNFVTNFTSAQAGANVTSQGGGTGFFNVNDTALAYNMAFTGLTGNITGANIYRGGMGMTGDSIYNIYDSFKGNMANGNIMWNQATPQIREAMLRDIMMGNEYIGINTSQYMNNELRSQVTTATGTGMKALLTAAQERDTVNNVDSTIGVGSFLLTNAGLAYNITVTNLTGPITTITFNRGPIKVNGDIVRTITGDVNGGNISGFWSINDNDSLTQGLMDDLLAGNIYVNVVTALNPGGELRGQIFINGGFGFTARMTGQEVVPSTTSNSVGTAAFTLTPAGLVYHGTLAGYTGSVGSISINNGMTGQSGPVVNTITNNFQNYQGFGVWHSTDQSAFDTSMIANLFARRLYVTVGTTANPQGDIRGQITTGDVLTDVTELPGAMSSDAEMSQNFPNPFGEITTISYMLATSMPVEITITDMLGGQVYKVLDNVYQEAGPHSVDFDASGLSTGVYYCTLRAGVTAKTIKLTVVR